MTIDKIATIVRYYRKQSGLSQQALAKLAGVGKTVIFDIEKGKETVQLNTLMKIIDVLNIKIKFETPPGLTQKDEMQGEDVSRLCGNDVNNGNVLASGDDLPTGGYTSVPKDGK